MTLIDILTFPLWFPIWWCLNKPEQVVRCDGGGITLEEEKEYENALV